MVRINKVYTKSGDKGQTSLAGGIRVDKNHPRVEAYGTVDELNSILGIVRHYNIEKPVSDRRDKLDLILRTIQNRLFDIGSLLATSPQSTSSVRPGLTENHVSWLEEVIDAMNLELEPLTSFLLPGGSPVNAFLHQSRTVCRRAERRVLRLSKEESIDPWILPYLNRLSDTLFVCSRWVAGTMGEEEYLWEPGQNNPDNWRWDPK